MLKERTKPSNSVPDYIKKSKNLIYSNKQTLILVG